MLLLPCQRTFLGEGERKGTPLEPWQGRTPLWRQLKGCRVLPAGVSGVSPDGPFLCSPPQAASKKRKRSFSGPRHTVPQTAFPEPRQRAGRPLQSHRKIVKLTPKRPYIPLNIVSAPHSTDAEIAACGFLVSK